MPKRIVDGEALWGSDTLALVKPESIRSEYANLIPLALANGVFECDHRHIWTAVYSFNRPSVTQDEVNSMLNEFERVKLLFRWRDQESGKLWGFWVKIDKPGRLPAPTRQGHEKLGPNPPEDLLRAFLAEPISDVVDGCRGDSPGVAQGFSEGAHAPPKHKHKPNGGVVGGVFVAPSVADVSAYMRSRGMDDPKGQAEAFFAHHANRDWRIGKEGRRMKDWKLAVVTWQHNGSRFNNGWRSNGKNREVTVTEDDRRKMEEYERNHPETF
jgi:hypothetical protein